MAGSRHTLKLRRSRLIGVERKEKRIMKILLIEDDIEISEMLCSYLIAENFEVVCAADGQKACEAFDIGSYSIVLLDLMISSKLKELLDTGSDEKVTVFTDNRALIELATQINRMLEDRQKVKVEYRRTEMASKKMLSNISHDIKTPMTVILGYLEIMRLNGTQSNEMLQKIESTARRVMGLITQFFTLAKLEAGDIDMPLERLNANEAYYNVDSVESALQMLDLTAAADQPVKSYSLGMKERLGIARAIMCKPELLILDEPTNGLDPAGMKQIRDLLKTLCSEYGITVMISSHILSEVESIADTIGIIHRGKMMKEIRMQDIEEMNLNYVELSVTDEKRAAYVLTEKLGLQNFKILDSGKIRIYDHAASTQQLTKILALNDVEVVSIGKKSETLEDYFLKLTGEVKYHA